MMLTKETLEKLAELDELRARFDKAAHDLKELIEADTEQKFSLCTTNIDTQWWYDPGKISAKEAKDILKDIADDANLDVKWEAADTVAYTFTVDRHPCIILIHETKEERDE